MGLANYVAGAFILPYAEFLQAAEQLQYDIDLLARQCGVEQHRAALFAGEAINTTEQRAVMHWLMDVRRMCTLRLARRGSMDLSCKQVMHSKSTMRLRCRCSYRRTRKFWCLIYRM